MPAGFEARGVAGEELEAEARELGIDGRSKMGKAELKRAVANAR